MITKPSSNNHIISSFKFGTDFYLRRVFCATKCTLKNKIQNNQNNAFLKEERKTKILAILVILIFWSFWFWSAECVCEKFAGEKSEQLKGHRCQREGCGLEDIFSRRKQISQMSESCQWQNLPIAARTPDILLFWDQVQHFCKTHLQISLPKDTM